MPFLSHWLWWTVLAVLALLTYLSQVKQQVLLETKNLRLFGRVADRVIFGSAVGAVNQRALLLSLAGLAAVWYHLGWIAALACFGANLVVSFPLLPLAKRHGIETAKVLKANPELDEILDSEELGDVVRTGRLR